MKRILLILGCLLLCFSTQVYASDINITFNNEIKMKKSQSEGILEIKVKNKKPYAGAEFGIQCGKDVTIKSVDYSVNGSTTSVTEGQGIQWFSYFSGSNDFKDEVTIKVNLQYSGNENTSVVIDNISIFTKNNNIIETFRRNERDVIKIIKEDSKNDIEDLVPPKELEDYNKEANKNSTNTSNKNNSENNNNGNESYENTVTTTIDKDKIIDEVVAGKINKTLVIALVLSLILNGSFIFIYLRNNFRKSRKVNDK